MGMSKKELKAYAKELAGPHVAFGAGEDAELGEAILRVLKENKKLKKKLKELEEKYEDYDR